MRYISKNTKEIIYLSLTLFVSFFIVVSAYIMKGSQYGITSKYLVLVFSIWIISLPILHLAFKYITKNTESAKVKIILYTIIVFLSVGCIISSLTGYMMSVGAISYYALLGYLTGLTMIIPELQYFGYFLYKIGFRKTLYLHTLINVTIISIGLYYSIWV